MKQEYVRLPKKLVSKLLHDTIVSGEHTGRLCHYAAACLREICYSGGVRKRNKYLLLTVSTLLDQAGKELGAL